MEKKIAPSEQKAQELSALVHGQLDAQSGEELLSTLVRLSTERVLQEALEQEQAEALGRGRYERREKERGIATATRAGTLQDGGRGVASASTANPGVGGTLSVTALESGGEDQ